MPAEVAVNLLPGGLWLCDPEIQDTGERFSTLDSCP